LPLPGKREKIAIKACCVLAITAIALLLLSKRPVLSFDSRVACTGRLPATEQLCAFSLPHNNLLLRKAASLERKFNNAIILREYPSFWGNGTQRVLQCTVLSVPYLEIMSFSKEIQSY
jgi:hypothetical protein